MPLGSERWQGWRKVMGWKILAHPVCWHSKLVENSLMAYISLYGASFSVLTRSKQYAE